MRKIALLVACSSLLASGCSVLGPPTAAPPSRPAATPQPTPSAGTVALTAAQIDLIRSYYSSNDAPGRGRNGGLPPGIAKNVARGKSLPPGIAKQYLPPDLVARLPAAPSGLEYVIVAGKLLLVEAATQIVRQVLLEAVFS